MSEVRTGMGEVRKGFHQQLDEIRGEIVRAGGIVIENIPQGTEVLLSADLEGANRLIDGDVELNLLTRSLEDRLYRLLALQQPMAGDLRSIVTAIRMTSEIERSGDLVVNICKGARRLYGNELEPSLRGLIGRMSEQAHLLYRYAIDSYVEADANLAMALGDIDDVLDRLHAEFIQAIFETHAASKLDLQAGVQLALIGRFYERIGDHAVNIGERVRYMVTGEIPLHPEDEPGEALSGSAEG
jgi:phosphate transport system protein